MPLHVPGNAIMLAERRQVLEFFRPQGTGARPPVADEPAPQPQRPAAPLQVPPIQIRSAPYTDVHLKDAAVASNGNGSHPLQEMACRGARRMLTND